MPDAPSPLRKLSDDEVLEWWAMYDAGHSVGQVADHFVRPAWAVHAKLTELKVIRDSRAHSPIGSGHPCHHKPRLDESEEDRVERRLLAASLLTTEAGRNIAAALARLVPELDGDRERPHFNDGTISGSFAYAHKRRHYCPISSRQREMDRLAKPRGVYPQVCSDLRAAGLLPGGSAGPRGRWS